jgi:AcrR family transcriptional regulator
MSKDPKPNRPATPRRTRDETRLLVLEVAARLFSRASYEAVSLDDIAGQAGVRKANLLYHFTSKEQLWYDTVDHVFAEVERFYAAEEGDGPENWGDLRGFVRTYFEACRLNPAYVLIPLIEGATTNWRSEWIAERYLRRHVHDFDLYVRRLIAEGALPPIEPVHLQNMLTGGVQHFVANAAVWERALGVDTRDKAFIDSYANSVLGLLERGWGGRVQT